MRWNGASTPTGFYRVRGVVAEPSSDVDQHAWYARHVLPEIDVLLRVALSMTGQPGDAEDLVQDTLLRAWRSIGSFDGRHPRAWLLTIMRNAEINRHRRRRPHLLDDPDTELERYAADRPAGASAEDTVVNRVFDDAVESALANSTSSPPAASPATSTCAGAAAWKPPPTPTSKPHSHATRNLPSTPPR